MSICHVTGFIRGVNLSLSLSHWIASEAKEGKKEGRNETQKRAYLKSTLIFLHALCGREGSININAVSLFILTFDY
jgi:hypothetical protein